MRSALLAGLLTSILASGARADDAPATAATAAPPAPAAPADPNKPYLVGLERTLSDAIVTDEGRSLAGYLSAALSHPVKGRIYKTYDDLVGALVKGEIDLAWINPYAYVKASEESKVFPVAKTLRKGDSYRAVLFVKSDSKVKKLTDLKGLKVAWVDKSSTAGYLFPQAMLLKQHIDPAKFFGSQSFAGTHRAVCDAVASGAADVGATFHTGDDQTNLQPDGCIESMGAGPAKQFVGIAITDPIPSEVIAARADFDEAVAAKLAGIFAGMSDTDAGKDILRTVFRADGFGLALDTDYDGVREAQELLAAGPPKDDAPAATSKKKTRTKKKKTTATDK